MTPRRPSIGVLRGIRGRLIVTYTVAAIVLAAIGGLLFTHQLSRGVQGNLDALVADRSAELLGGLQGSETPALVNVQAHFSGRTDAIQQLYGPDGALRASDPSDLPALLSPERFALAATGDVQTFTASYDGTRLRMRAVALPRTGSTDPASDGTWVVLTGASLSQADDAVGDLRQVLLVATPMALIAVALGTWLLSGAALAPVERMRQEADELAQEPDRDASRSDSRLTVPDTGDEIEALGRTLNSMLDRQQASLDLQREALRQQRDFVADAGHELRTPLAVLRTELELADRPSRSRDQLLDSIRHAADEVDRLIALSNSLLALARADSAGDAAVVTVRDISGALDEAVRSWRDECATRQIDLVGDWTAPVLGRISDESARQVLDNLLSNATRHTPRGGTVTVSAHPAEGAPYCEIVVRDTGPGMPDGFAEHAFERFSRSDAARSRRTGHGEPSSGAGLGLAIVQAIVHGTGGTATAANEPSGGAAITLRIPA